MITTWSINIENMSADDIASEPEYLKHTYKSTSLPKPADAASSASTEQMYVPSATDDECWDPSYGATKKKKHSLRPGRKPSLTRIAVQKIICKTRAVKPSSIPLPTPKRTHSTPPTGKSNKRRKTVDDMNPVNLPLSPKTDNDPVPSKRKFGLKITHHGLCKQVQKEKGQKYICDMCGKKFQSSTTFIEHYKITHPTLKCKDCEKVYNNPLSLQKHHYVHSSQEKQEKCENCGRTFPFASQLADHRKSHLKQWPHVCSHIGCGKDFTRRHDLHKHERTHIKHSLKCDHCEYKTKDVRNMKQHNQTHTGEKPYCCNKCNKRFTFYMQKKRHSC